MKRQRQRIRDREKMCEKDEQMRMKEMKRNTSRDTDKQLVRLACKQTECTRDRNTQRQTD